ncbi:MAG: hypothetical protein WCW27_06620 [Patescibacteria group bacterium]|jgi:ribosomal protein L35
MAKKLKTVKTISKRIKVSGGKNHTLIIRTAGQDHFNARQRSKTKRNKRSNRTVHKTIERTTRSVINY